MTCILQDTIMENVLLCLTTLMDAESYPGWPESRNSRSEGRKDSGGRS